jgi:type I restriction enzyme S subunit
MTVRLPLADILRDAKLFTDGDWVESKDQDVNGDVRLTQLADVGDGEWLNRSNRYMTSTKAAALKCTFLEAGDLLVARMPDPLGRCCVFPGESMPCVTVVDVCVIRPDTKKICPRYLMHAINAPSTRAAMENFVVGTTRPRISRKNIGKVTVALPALAEQRQIASMLDSAARLRTKRLASIEQLDSLVQATFLEMFGDPVMNPKGWGISPFGKVGDCRLGKMLDKGKKKGGIELPYLANKNVQWNYIDVHDLRTMEFTTDDQAEFALQDGDLLICEGGEVGRSAIWRGPSKGIFFQKALHRMRADRRVAAPEYLLYFMWVMARRGGFNDYTNSATIAHLTGVQLKRLPCPVPPLKLQTRFASVVESIEQHKARLKAQLAELDTLFASLQSLAFKGPPNP